MAAAFRKGLGETGLLIVVLALVKPLSPPGDCRVNSSAAQSRHSFRWSLGRCRSASLRTVGANLRQYFSHFCDSHERTNVCPGECHIVASYLALGLSIVSNMYRFTRGTIFYAPPFLPSKSLTQPFSTN